MRTRLLLVLGKLSVNNAIYNIGIHRPEKVLTAKIQKLLLQTTLLCLVLKWQ